MVEIAADRADFTNEAEPTTDVAHGIDLSAVIKSPEQLEWT